ncbi:hypothetical protein D3C79_867350 [compost metagenome]
MLTGCVHDRYETLQAFADRAVDVALGEGFGCGGEHRNLFHPGCQGILETAQVRRQGGVGDAGLLLDVGKHLGGAGHLRHPLGRDETAHFYIGQARRRQVIDQPDLVCHADGLGFVLQAVARTDFDQTDCFRQ